MKKNEKEFKCFSTKKRILIICCIIFLIFLIFVLFNNDKPDSKWNIFKIFDNLRAGNEPHVVYQVHQQHYGWFGSGDVTRTCSPDEPNCVEEWVKNSDWEKDGSWSGIKGHFKRVEAFKVKLENQPYEGDIEYQAHIQGTGWVDWVKNGALAGTTGESRRLEAIKIKLTGDMAKHYDIYYRVHCQSYGDFNWAKNGEPAGTEGVGKRIESISIMLVEKGATSPITNPNISSYATNAEIIQ